MYAKVCQIEILSSYLTDVSIGDILCVEALITNPLDWHHFFDMITLIKRESKTDFTIVTDYGERIVGSGVVMDIEKWSNNGQFGFKIKIKIKQQKSLSDRRIRPIHSKVSQTIVKREIVDNESQIPDIRQPLTA